MVGFATYCPKMTGKKEIKKMLSNYEVMTDEEQKQALKEFRQVIKMGRISYTHADPLKENCYITSGEIWGLFFPNSEIVAENYKPEKYEFIAVIKNGGDFGAVFEDVTDAPQKFAFIDPYIFVPFRDMIYNRTESRIIQELEQRIKTAEKDLFILNNIKYVTKKDGAPFENIKKNFDPQPAENIKLSVCRDDYRFIFYLSESKTSKNGVNYNNYYNIDIWCGNSFDALKTAVEQAKAGRAQSIRDYKNDIKNIHKISKVIDAYNIAMSGCSFATRKAAKDFIKV